MYCIIKRIVQGKQARIKNADLRHPSRTVVMQKTQICVTRPQCVNIRIIFASKLDLLNRASLPVF